MEKEYRFTATTSADTPDDIIFVKESELKDWQKDLLLGDAINKFNNLPDELKNKFMARMNDSLFNKMQNEM